MFHPILLPVLPLLALLILPSLSLQAQDAAEASKKIVEAYDNNRFEEAAKLAQAFIQATHKQWPQQVQRALRLMALHGIHDPLTRQPVPPAALRISGSNYRETVEVDGCLARHRAILLVLQQLVDAGLVHAAADLQIYCPEFVTPFAERLLLLKGRRKRAPEKDPPA